MTPLLAEALDFQSLHGVVHHHMGLSCAAYVMSGSADSPL